MKFHKVYLSSCSFHACVIRQEIFHCQSVGAAINKRNTDWVDKQQMFISHVPGGWEIQDQGADIFGVC